MQTGQKSTQQQQQEVLNQQQQQAVIFCPTLPQQTRQALNIQMVQIVLKSDKWWNICNSFHNKEENSFNVNKWNFIFPFIISTPCSELWLADNMYDQMIIDISKTNFLKLKQLRLMGNSINSIEQLQFINFPFLEQLDLSKNTITNPNSLNKLPYSSFKNLYLHRNPILQIEISRLNLAKDCQGKKYYADDYESGKSILLLAKLNFNMILLLSSEQRLTTNSKKIRSLEQKGIKIEFFNG